MKYSTKSAQYYNYFEDAKILEIDNENKKLAVVLNGKDDIINIFDASPYINYNHFEYYTKEEQIKSEENKKKKGIIQIEEQRNNLDVNQIFEEIKNYKNNISQNSNQNNSNIYLSSSTYSNSNHQLILGQNLLGYDNLKNQRPKRETSTFSRMLSVFNKENKEHQLEKDNNKAKKRKYDLLFVSKFNIYYNSPSNFADKSFISIKKPKIKHRLLSVIQLTNDSVLGIKWFSLNDIGGDINLMRNLSEKDRYFARSKMILVISQEGCASVYKLVDYNPYQVTRVNLYINALQSQPFLNFKEQYTNVASVNISNPILDFNLLNQSLEDNDKNYVRLVTLHINNSFTFWYIINKNGKFELRIQFNFTLTDFTCENFLIDSREEYLICFNKTGLNIYLAKGQNFPYPIVYRYSFNDILPPLDELRKIIYNNDIINDEKEEKNEIKEENKKNEGKNEEIIKKNQNKKNEQNEDIINMDEEKEEKKEPKKKKGKKGKKKNNEKEDQQKKEDEDNKYPKNKKEKKKKKEKEVINEDIKVEIYDEVIKFKLKNYNAEEEDMEEEDEIDENDDFEVEGNPGFIDKDLDIFFDDDKYLKFLQKPVFLSSEAKFLFVNYEVKSNQYSLYCFNFIGLFQIEENKDFLEKCLNKFDPNLITKIYTSKEKIYFSESPLYYFNPVKVDSVDNNLINTINGRKQLKEKKFELKNILDNSYHGLFIRDGDYIMIFKISINEAPDLDLINHDINSTKFRFFEQPTSENLKSNRFALWAYNNTLFINSVDCLFHMIKFRNESDILGIAISKKRLVEYMNKFYYS